MGFSSKARVTKSRSIARVTAPPAAQIFAPTGASLVTEGGTPVFGGPNVSPTGAQLVTQGGTPVYGGINARPTGASLVAQGGTPTVWWPGLLTNLFAWYSAPYLTGFVDNDPVGTWTELGPNGYDATGATTPTFKTNQQNGQPGILFTEASGQQLKTGALTLSQPATIWVVAQTTEAPPAPTHFLCDGTDASNRMGIFGNSATSNWCLFAGTTLLGSVAVDTNWHLFVATFNGGSSTLTIDGSSAASGNAGTQGIAGIALGSAYPTTNETTGFLGEVGYASGALSAGDLANLKAYVRLVWGLTIA